MRQGSWTFIVIVIVVAAASALGGVGSRDSRGGGDDAEVTLTSERPLKGSRGRIINGKMVDEPTAKVRYPGLVALFDTRGAGSPNGGFFCGGTLVTRTLVLTAAHCVDATTQTTVRVLAGTTWLDESNRAESQLVSATKIVKHPGWNRFSIQAGNDLAVITLATPVNTPAAAPMSVVGPGEDNIWGAGRGVSPDPVRGPYLAGWGDTEEGEARFLPKFPMDINAQILPDGSCTAYMGSAFVPANNMCAGGERTDDVVGSGGCQGDSGGPIVANANGPWRVVGVVSYGAMTCDPTRPAAYVKLANYRAWLQQQGVPVGTGSVPEVLPAPAVTGRGYVVPSGPPITIDSPSDAGTYDELDELVSFDWTLRSDQRASSFVLRNGATEVLRRDVSGLVGFSMPTGGLAAGAYTWCVGSADDFSGAPVGEACRTFTRVAAHKATMTRATFSRRAASYTGQVVSTEPTVRVTVQVKSGRKLVAKKSLVVKLSGPGRVTNFSWKGVAPKGARPRSLSSRIIVEGGGAKRGFNGVLR